MGSSRWIARGALILVIAAGVSMLLPGVKQWLAADRCLDSGGGYDYTERVCRTDVVQLPTVGSAWVQRPDGGSIIVGLAVAVALTRLFTTLDRRRAVGPNA